MSRTLYQDDGCLILYSKMRYGKRWQYLVQIYFDAGENAYVSKRFEQDEVPNGMQKDELIIYLLMLTQMYFEYN